LCFQLVEAGLFKAKSQARSDVASFIVSISGRESTSHICRDCVEKQPAFAIKSDG
jgi:hypothetical protein